MPDELLMPNDDTSVPEVTLFPHVTGAHCESAAMRGLLAHEGLALSESMVFGLSSALTFCYFPFVRINGLPLLSYRMMRCYILKNLKRLLHLPLHFESFKDSATGMRRLDELIAQGRPVGLQGSIMYLTYFPTSWRFPFNAHNFIAYGRDAVSGDYHISDPVIAVPTRCTKPDLTRARFVRGSLAPNGFLYYLDGKLPSTDPAQVVPHLRGAIRKNATMMGGAVIPFVGTLGMRFFAARLRRLPVSGSAAKVEYTRNFIGHIARMQEEIGTGGAGFRYMYAAFLDEAATLLNNPALHELSCELSDNISPDWRNLAMLAARQNKQRDELDPRGIAALIDNVSAKERAFFIKLRKAV